MPRNRGFDWNYQPLKITPKISEKKIVFFFSFYFFVADCYSFCRQSTRKQANQFVFLLYFSLCRLTLFTSHWLYLVSFHTQAKKLHWLWRVLKAFWIQQVQRCCLCYHEENAKKPNRKQETLKSGGKYNEELSE